MDSDLLMSANEMKMRQQERAMAAEAQLREARELLLHFQFIAHGPGCDCPMCSRRAAFLERTKPAADTACDPK